MSMMVRLLLVAVLTLTAVSPIFAQAVRKDRGMFHEDRNEFLDSLKAESARFLAPAKPDTAAFRLDFTTIDAPQSAGVFKSHWHLPPISQGISGMCWCFSATSFYESEIYRLTKRSIKLSELYTVYWEYVEKAREWVRTRGTSEFGQGSESNAVPRIWKKYGIVPADAYTGLKPGQKFHDHDPMFNEMVRYLEGVRDQHAWNEEAVVATIRNILNHHINTPPEKVTVGGVPMTPREYLRNIVRLNLDDYVEILSIKQQPYYQRVEYEVPDNWWHNKDYHNVPLDEFMAVIGSATRNGYTLAIGGDVSEAGYEGHAGIGVVPTFDIPAEYIDEDARQFRFSNKTTRDDHGVHMVGWTERNGVDWYLIKDSAAGSRNNTHPGYYFYRSDYVKLKMLGITVHRDAAKELLAKFTR
jgi:bleomycin hydrolase